MWDGDDEDGVEGPQAEELMNSYDDRLQLLNGLQVQLKYLLHDARELKLPFLNHLLLMVDAEISEQKSTLKTRGSAPENGLQRTPPDGGDNG
jgi:hypothetical protein